MSIKIVESYSLPQIRKGALIDPSMEDAVSQNNGVSIREEALSPSELPQEKEQRDVMSKKATLAVLPEVAEFHRDRVPHQRIRYPRRVCYTIPEETEETDSI